MCRSAPVRRAGGRRTRLVAGRLPTPRALVAAGAALVLMIVLVSARVVAEPCPGDCDGSGAVTIDELVLAVSIALSANPVARCASLDHDGNGAITIDELITAVDFALGACPTDATATATRAPIFPTPTATVVRTPPAVTIEGRLRVTSDFLGQGAGERQTIIGDCNGDGLLDVVRTQRDASNVPELYVQSRDGAFVRVDPGWDFSAVSGAFSDLDGDGMQDIVLADQSVFILHGHGDCTFDAPQTIERVCPGYPILQTLVTDVDLDGLADIALSCIGASPTQILLARGDGGYELASPPPDVLATDYPMFGMLYDDVDGDAVRDLFMMVDTGKSWFSWGVRGDAPQYEIDEALSAVIAPIDPMGTALLDYDRDGSIEYFVSGTRTNQFYRHRGPRDIVDVAAAAAIASNEDATSYSPYATDLNLDGWTDLVVVRKGGYRPDDEHPVYPYVFVNQRDGTFRDMGPDLINTPMIAVMMTCGDLASDGHVACFVGDGRGTFVLHNEIAPAGNWIGVRLRGTVSSPEAAGARVSIDGEAPPLIVVAGGQSPAWGEHAREVLLGIGDRSTAGLSIEWPSGVVQRVDSVAAGSYMTVSEPNVVAVSSRVVPADGETLVTISVDVNAVQATTASIDREGAGTWEAPASFANGLLTRQLRAPGAAGSARIVVRLDDIPLRVRPRVRFE